MIRFFFFFIFYDFFYKKILISTFYKFLFIYYFDFIIIIFFSNLLFVIFLFFGKIINNFIKKRVHSQKVDLYFYDFYDFVKSSLILLFFFFYYVINVRLVIFFSEKKFDFNLFSIKNVYNDNNFIFILILLFLIMLLYIYLYLFFQIMFFFTKKHYLKLHYYIFRRIKNYNNFIDKTIKFDFFLKVFLNDYYIYFYFFRCYIFTFIYVFLFFRSLFFKDGELNELLVFLPYYGMYMFINNIYNFITTKFQIDFEILIMESYYEKLLFVMERNDDKKLEYKKYLISGYSKFKFVDSIFLFDITKIEHNNLIIQTNKFDLNKIPNDFFSRIYKKKPNFLSKK